MGRTHFLVSESPQKFDQSIQALCGATLKNPEPVVMVEIGSRGLPEFQNLRDCGRCYRSAELGEQMTKGGRIYLYGLIEGEEAMHSGDTIERIEKLVEAKSTQQ